jgi:hypothetical protein
LLPFNSASYVCLSDTKAIDIKIQRTTVLPVVFYEYETWLVIHREEHRLSAFERNAKKYWMHFPQDRSKCCTL